MLSRAELTAIADECYNDIFRFCFSRLWDHDAAADITQEVFLLLQQKSDELQNENMRAWLFLTANNKLKKYLYEKKVKSPLSLDEELPQKHSYDLEDVTQAAYQSFECIEERKEEVLSKLTEEDRQLFHVAFTEKKKHCDIARAYRISENALAVRICRLRKRIVSVIKSLH